MPARYDRIGTGYSRVRRPDSRIAAAIDAALGNSLTLLNVGAGAGSYEPAGRKLIAVEPSAEMISQRPTGSAPVIQAVAEALPFVDRSFDASMAILTIHHWADKPRGVKEMRRVTCGPVVLLTFDPAHRDLWLLDYLPDLARLDEAQMPGMADYENWLGPVEIRPIPIPHDCTDGFLYAYWRRPEAYLDPETRSASSSFWTLDGVEAGIERLKADLGSGEWHRRHADLLGLQAFDAGYRLVVARGG